MGRKITGKEWEEITRRMLFLLAEVEEPKRPDRLQFFDLGNAGIHWELWYLPENDVVREEYDSLGRWKVNITDKEKREAAAWMHEIYNRLPLNHLLQIQRHRTKEKPGKLVYWIGGKNWSTFLDDTEEYFRDA